MVARKLEIPESYGREKGTGIIPKEEQGKDLALRRELARKRAEEKARARTLAKRQAMVERIASSAAQMLSAVDELNSAIEELGKSMEQIATGAEQASSAADESRAAVNQINASGQNIRKLVSEMVQKVSIAQDQAGVVRGSLQSLIENIQEAASRNQESAQLIRKLEDQSNRIEEIVKAVVMIADQTNLLALNAAIEAARAEEHGSGFAVVADEVRNLAETSENSARQIREVVGEIKEAVQKEEAESIKKQVEEVGGAIEIK